MKQNDKRSKAMIDRNQWIWYLDQKEENNKREHTEEQEQ